MGITDSSGDVLGAVKDGKVELVQLPSEHQVTGWGTVSGLTIAWTQSSNFLPSNRANCAEGWSRCSEPRIPPERDTDRTAR